MKKESKDLIKLISEVSNDDIFRRNFDYDEDGDAFDQRKKEQQDLIDQIHQHVDNLIASHHEDEANPFKFEANGKRYTYKNLRHAMGAYGDSLIAHHHAHGLMDLDPHNNPEHVEPFTRISESVMKKLSPFNEAMIDHHNKIFDKLYQQHPQFKRSIDIFKGHYGASQEAVRAHTFSDRMNTGVMIPSGLKFDLLSRMHGGDLRSALTSKLNQGVTEHSHPLGIILSGGLTGNRRPTVEKLK